MFRRRRNDFNGSGSAGLRNSYLLSHNSYLLPGAPGGPPHDAGTARSMPQGRRSAARGNRCGERGRMVCAPTPSCLPFRFMLLPPRRERRVLRGEGGALIHTNICRKRFILLQTERRHVEVYHAQFIQHQ